MSRVGVAPIVIIGIGNSMRRDDGVGLAAVAHFQDGTLPIDEASLDVRTLDGEPARLIEAWKGRRRVVVIDAAKAGSAPGTIHRIEVGVDSLPDWANVASSHSAGIAEAIALARALDALPEGLIIYGVEPADVAMGEGLTESVESAIPELVRRITAEVQG